MIAPLNVLLLTKVKSSLSSFSNFTRD